MIVATFTTMFVEPGIIDTNIWAYALDADALQHVASRSLLDAGRTGADAFLLPRKFLRILFLRDQSASQATQRRRCDGVKRSACDSRSGLHQVLQHPAAAHCPGDSPPDFRSPVHLAEKNIRRGVIKKEDRQPSPPGPRDLTLDLAFDGATKRLHDATGFRQRNHAHEARRPGLWSRRAASSTSRLFSSSVAWSPA